MLPGSEIMGVWSWILLEILSIALEAMDYQETLKIKEPPGE